MENKPIRGVSFNAYAIVGLLVITPLYLALVTSVAGGGGVSEDKMSLLPEDGNVINAYNDPNLPNMSGYGGLSNSNGNNIISTWVDIGDNMTSAYVNEYGITNLEDLRCLWLFEKYPYYGHPEQQNGYGGPVSSAETGVISTPNTDTSCRNMGRLNDATTFGGSSIIANINGIVHTAVPQNHFGVSVESAHPYIGSSGSGEFKFSIENPVFQGLDDEKGIGSLHVSMYADYNSIQYDCDTAISDNITFDYSIEIFQKPGNQTTHPTTIFNNPSIKFDDFRYEGDNIIAMNYQQNGIVCTTGFELDFTLTVFESMDLTDFKEIYGTYENFSAIVTMDNFENEDNPGDLIGETPLPFAGDDAFYIGYSVDYVNEATTNFILKGGTLLLGIGFFWLSIASTPYYDPLKNRFKGAV